MNLIGGESMNIGRNLTINTKRYPNRWALTCEGRTYTYAQLNEKVNSLANGLLKQGFKKGDKIALYMKNSDDFVIVFYAIMKAGCVAVPINFRLVATEARYILEQSESVIIFCDGEFEKVVENASQSVSTLKKIVVVSNESEYTTLAEMYASNTNEPDIIVEPTDDAEILYTSGTTGRPKGALFDHQRIVTLNAMLAMALGFRAEDRFLHIAPLFHCAALNVFLNPFICVGAGQVIHRDFNPIAVLETIQEYKVTKFFGVPAMYNALLQVPNTAAYDLSSITSCMYGAAPMAPELIKKCIQLLKTDQFYNICGLTESGPTGIILNPEEHKTKLGAGGKPILYTEARVVNDLMEDVHPGEIGEFILRSPSIMKEYYRKPEETAKTFVGDWLLTGDLATIDEDGYMTIVDRKKDMIISGGENVYSVEVEQVMYYHPNVLEVATIGVPDEKWGETVAVVIVTKDKQPIPMEELQSFCREHLAGYKIPRKAFFVDQLPRNASGKILKYNLRDQFTN